MVYGKKTTKLTQNATWSWVNWNKISTLLKTWKWNLKCDIHTYICYRVVEMEYFSYQWIQLPSKYIVLLHVYSYTYLQNVDWVSFGMDKFTYTYWKWKFSKTNDDQCWFLENERWKFLEAWLPEILFFHQVGSLSMDSLNMTIFNE